MEAKLNRSLSICTLLAALAFGMSVQAEDTCYRGDGGSGELSFSGVLEGKPFEGKFNKVSVRYCDGRIEVSVTTKSAAVGNRDGDEAMASEEFFHPVKWPEATWNADAAAANDGPQQVSGTLTIRGIAREVPVTLTLEHSDERVRLSGEASIMRLDFDVGIGEFKDTSFITNEVHIQFDFMLEH